jgi:hypothetical protein
MMKRGRIEGDRRRERKGRRERQGEEKIDILLWCSCPIFQHAWAK